MTSLLQDVRFGWRLFRLQPGFTAVALLVLSVGIGVNTAAFGLVNALLLKPRIGGVDASLTGLFSRDRQHPDAYREFTWDELVALRARRDLFQAVAGHGFGLVGLEEGDATRRVFADIVSANFFETFGVAPALGRAFTAEEERPGADVPVVIISAGLHRRMGGTPDIVGRSITINTREFTIVGVAPEGFGGSMVMVTPEVWVPTGVYSSMNYDRRNEGAAAELGAPAFRALIVVARLAEGQTIATIGPGLDAMTRQFAAADPADSANHELVAAPLSRLSVSTRPQVDDELSAVAVLLLSLAGVVLLIASFNLANMLLARGRARGREFAIRVAIGGGRARLVRQLFTESVMLALLGGLGGLMLSSWAMGYLLVSMPSVMPISLAFDSTPDIRVLGSALGFSTLAAVVFGSAPAWKLSRTDALAALKEQAGDSSSGRTWLTWLNTRDALVMGQLALSFVMLTAAGLFVRGAVEAASSDPGFTLDRGVIANLDTTFVNYPVQRNREFFQTALARLRAMPGVAAAGMASHMPFGEFETSVLVQLPGPPIRPNDAGADAAVVDATTASISGDYFSTMGIRIVRGREFNANEEFSADGEPVAIIDVGVAERLFGTADPVGSRVQVRGDREGDPPIRLRVVGVASGIRASLFDEGPRPFFYRPFGQEPRGAMYLHARTSGGSADAEEALLPAIRLMVLDLEPRSTIVSLETRPMFRERNLLLAVMRTGALIFAAFGVAALFLAAAGVYGVKSYLVSRRTREIGLRVALGAEPRDVVRMVLKEGLVLVAMGLVAGAGLSLLTGQVLRGMLFQGRALDLPVVTIAAITLVASVLLASWLPARRAIRVSPTTALRAH